MKSVSYKEGLYEMLRDDPEFVTEYLNEAIIDNDQEAFRIAMQNIIEAKRFSLKIIEEETA